MLDVECAKDKLEAVVRLISHLRSGDFPYVEPRTVLEQIATIFEKELQRVASIDSGTDTKIRQHICSQANFQIACYYPYLGFVLRATNVRNAFEVYDPLLNLFRRAYGSDAKLVLSSEWDFSPFTYPAVVPDLPHVIFIGSPVSEADNALLVPLTGHELGHSLWRAGTGPFATHVASLKKELQKAVADRFRSNWTTFRQTFAIDPSVTPDKLLRDLLLRPLWTGSYRLALRQLEELFCDSAGLRLFGEGFLYSFAYVLSPNVGERAPHYPSLAARVASLKISSAKFGTDYPSDFDSLFNEPGRSLSAADQFLLAMADEAVATLVGRVADIVDAVFHSQSVPKPTGSERDRIASAFKIGCPAMSPVCIADIINAGWSVKLDGAIAARSTLCDLVFKTIEVLEYEERTSHA